MSEQQKWDADVDRLVAQLVYAFEHGQGHGGHMANAYATATALSKRLAGHADLMRRSVDALMETDRDGDYPLIEALEAALSTSRVNNGGKP